ncbi:c-type cytochrome [Mucilaginibacter sp. ZT4R22]|uniref:C-type cytochrome n=1 Tax=Mucilaginibacter pankratovii TaxID=2772110 RepID=A0ABR7WYB0_9SPHI|nr:c-type cytochrome [Mucilaginibacter pankratovii]MBD1367274.1 c-type cytochrome [Mucilaginibacter pankratovii]
MKFKIIAGLVLILSVIIASCGSAEDMEFKRYYLGGEQLYKQRCQNCHGTKGEGLSNLIPPLTDSTFLKTNKKQLACIVNNGLKGALVVVNGKSFVGDMPANNIPPVDIARILTYITNSFGNKMGTVKSEDVALSLKDCK